jgi:conjugative relaxase-like TrwC/TraI family protein
MIFINHQKSASAAKDYYTQHIAPGDGRYYTEENSTQLKGVWHGRGAEKLHLSGEVRQEDFFRLCDNINPSTGERLTARTDADRRVMTDLTFDVPKSVTLAYELGDDERILDAFRQSMSETMVDIERNVQTRVRKNGADHDRTTGNLIWAEHIHRTARPVTNKETNEQSVCPQLHAHATVVNATFDAVEKRWKAIQLGDIVRDKGNYQARFHARLAHRLKALGYGIEKRGNSFEIAGIDRPTIEKFSQRHGVINNQAERLGTLDPESKAKIARRSREKKNHEPQSMEELRRAWDARLTPEERLAIKTAAMGLAKGDAAITPEQAMQYAFEHSYVKTSAVSDKRLQAEALTYAVGSVLPEDVADIAQHPEAIPVKHDGQLFVTTKTVLGNEVAFLQFAKDGQRKQKPFAFIGGLSENDYNPLNSLSAEQRQAALHILNSRDTVTGIVGKAGTGKTRMMRATVDAIEGAGHRVYAFAPSSQASRGVLKKEGFQNAETLEMLLKNERMQDQVKGQVLWVDEAGLVSSKDMRRMMDIAKRNDNRVILSGDYIQHSSVEAGDAFRLLEMEAGVKFARLSENRRQTLPGYKKAVEQISSGTGAGAQKGFDALDKMGWVVEASGDDRHQLLVKDYLKAQEEGKSALIIAPTHAEGQRLTDELRTALKERGALGTEHEFISRKSTGWTDAQKGDLRNYEPSMVLEFNQNAKGFKRSEKLVAVDSSVGAREKAVPKLGRLRAKAALSAEPGQHLAAMREDGSRITLPLEQAQRFDVFRTRRIAIAKGDRIRITKNGDAKVEGQTKGTRVNNGDIFTVEGFTKEGDIRLENGKLLPKNWGHLSLGYVDTSYASQGKTVDRVFIATGKESLAAANQQQWYVSASRGREQAKIYVEDKQDVRDAIARTGQRLSAVELTHTRLRPSWRHRFNQSLERNRVGRFLKQRAAAVADYWRSRESLTYA